MDNIEVYFNLNESVSRLIGVLGRHNGSDSEFIELLAIKNMVAGSLVAVGQIVADEIVGL